MSSIRSSSSAKSGQAGILTTAVIMVLAMAVIGVSISTVALYNSKRTVVNKDSLQLYYVAQAGVQEAIATRMAPRSNYANFITSGTGRPVPFLQESSKVYQDPSNRNTNLVGMYRYIALGGDPVRNGAGNVDPTRWLSDTAVQNFYVLSRGSVCRDPNTGNVLTDRIEADPGNTGAVRCKNGSQQDDLTILARVDLSRTDATAPNKDLIRDFRVLKPANPTDNLTLAQSVFVPGVGVTNQVNFESAFRYAGTANVTPYEIVFYRLSDSTPYKKLPINGPNQTYPINQSNPADQIDPKSVIRIYFNGPVDYRTMFVGHKNSTNSSGAVSTGNTQDCLSDASKCTIRLLDSAGTAYGGSTLIPHFPDSNQLLFFPPLQGVNIIPGAGGTGQFKIVIERNLTDYNGNALGQKYELTFNLT